MSRQQFFYAGLFHVTLAATVWVVIALSLEFFIPRFVTPYVNLPGAMLIALGLNVLLVVQRPFEESKGGWSAWQLTGLMVLLLLSESFILLKINDGSKLNFGLALVSLVLTCGLLIFLPSEPPK